MKSKKVVVNLLFILIFCSAVLFGTPSQLAKLVQRVTAGEDLSNVVDPLISPMVTVPTPISYLDSFHFIEPLAARSGDPAKFDASLINYLKIEICEVSYECTLIKTFSAQSPSSERIRIEKGGGWTYYIANWDTQRVNLGGKTYRVRVFAADLLLGEVELTPEIYNTFGRTWPIKFMIENDPAIRVRVLRLSGKACVQIASAIKTEFGLSAEEVGGLLAGDMLPCSSQEIDLALRGVFQNVVVPDTTKVADDATGAAMSAFDPVSGNIIFSFETTILKNLRIGDVLVGDPNAAAPYGYLRKVNSKTKVRGQVILETSQASLTEAVHQGTLDARGELLPADEVPTGPSVSQSTSLRSTEVNEPQSAESVGSVCSDSNGSTGYNFQCSVDVTIDANTPGPGEFTGTGHVHIAGNVYFNAGYDLGLGVELCARAPIPACVDRFEARLRVQQKSELHIDGTLDARVFKEIVVARKIFRPIIFMVGPVPVWIVPVANLVVGARGDAHIGFTFNATDEANFAVGAKWTDPGDGGQGWQNVSEASITGNAGGSLEGSLDLRGYYKGNAKLLLYGVAGPSFGGALGGRAHFQIPGKPVWAIYGRVDGDLAFELSVIDVITLSRFSLDEFLVSEIPLKEAPNFAPRCTSTGALTTVNIASSFYMGPTTPGGSGFFDCMDPEGQAISYTFTSNFPSSDTINNATHRVTFGQPFTVHAITANATDDEGGTGNPVTMYFNVINPPPNVEINVATDTVPMGVQYFINALAWDPDQGAYLDCIRRGPTSEQDQIRFDFLVDAPHTVQKIGDGFNCSAVAIFNQTGPQTIRVVAIDKFGNPGTQVVNVNVTAAPPNPAPVIDVSSISFEAVASKNVFLEAGATIYVCQTDQRCPIPNGAEVAGGPSSFSAQYKLPFYMSLSATDQGTTPTVTWFCREGSNSPALATPVGGGVYSCNAFGPARDVFIGAAVSDGVTTVYSEIRKYRTTPLANPN